MTTSTCLWTSACLLGASWGATTCPDRCLGGNCQIGDDYLDAYPDMNGKVCYHACSIFNWCGVTEAHYSFGTDCCACAPDGTDFSAYKDGNGGKTKSGLPTCTLTTTCPDRCKGGGSACRIGDDYLDAYPDMNGKVCYHACSIFNWCGVTEAHYSFGTDCCACAPDGTDFSAYKDGNGGETKSGLPTCSVVAAGSSLYAVEAVGSEQDGSRNMVLGIAASSVVTFIFSFSVIRVTRSRREVAASPRDVDTLE